MKRRQLWKRVMLSLILLGAIWAGWAHAEGNVEQSSQKIAVDLKEYFPTAEGTIVSVREDSVFVDVGSAQKMRVGMHLAFLLEGVEIVHPTTNEVLGSYEQQIGALQLTEVMDDFSVARIIWKEPDAQLVAGGKVGGIPGNVKVAVLPLHNATELTINQELLSTTLLAALKQQERFTVFSEADMKAAGLSANIPAEDDEVNIEYLAAMNKELEAHYFLQPEIHPDGEQLLWQVRVLSERGEDVGSVQDILHKSAGLLLPDEGTVAQARSEAQAEEDIASTEGVSSESTEPFDSWTSDIFKLEAHKMAAGDVTGDGKNELILSTSTDFHIMSYERLGSHATFLPFKLIEGYNDALILSLDAGDFNGNGRAEIFVTTLRGARTELRVYEYTGEDIEEIWGEGGLALRIITTLDKTKHLIGQLTSSSKGRRFFMGRIAEYEWNGEEYVPFRTIDPPPRINFWDFTIADVNSDGSEEWVAYDRNDRIKVYRGREDIWSTGEKYENFKVRVVRKGEEDRNPDRFLRGRIAVTRLAPDDAVHLAIFRNFRPYGFLQTMPMYRGSQFTLFQWQQNQFISIFQSEKFDPYIVDYVVADLDHDGKLEAALAMVLKDDDWFKTPQSHIMVYNIE